MSQIDLPTLGLRNEIKSEIQNLRKAFECNLTDRIDCHVELKTTNNWFILFASPFLTDDGLTNIEYLKEHCLLSSISVDLNGLFFDGIYPVHNPKLESIISKSNLKLYRKFEHDFPKDWFGDNIVTISTYQIIS